MTSVSVPHLIVHDDIGRRVVPLSLSPITLGRGMDNAVQIAGAGVSLIHADLVRTDGRWLLRDRTPGNGVMVNGVRVHEQLLSHGDRVELGPGGVEVTFQEHGDERPLATASSGVGESTELLNVFRRLSPERAVEAVLTTILDTVIESTGAERGFLMLADGGLLGLRVARHAGGLAVPSDSFDAGQIPEEVFTSGETRAHAVSGSGAIVETAGVVPVARFVLCAPLRLRDGTLEGAAATPRIIGVVYLDGHDGARLLSSASRTALDATAVDAARAIDYARLYQRALDKARLDDELNIASKIQQALLPEPRQVGLFFEAVGASKPSRAIGGDFFDYQARPRGTFGFALGDVTGKGPPAALLTSLVQGMLAAQADTDASPSALLSQINRILLTRRLESRFLTIFLAMLTPDGRLTYSNGGQNPPLLLTREGIRRLEAGGTLLGAFPNASYPEETVQLEVGDTLVLFSDGVTDAISAEGVPFGDDRLEVMLSVVDEGTPDDVLRELFDTVDEFARGAEQQDDLTAVVVRYKGQA